MLPKQHRLRRDQDFQRIFSKGQSVFDPICGIRFGKNSLEESRFAVVVGTKVHKSAVKRNKIRRQYRDIVKNHLSQIKSGFDIILLTSKETIPLNYAEKEQALLSVLKKAGLLV